MANCIVLVLMIMANCIAHLYLLWRIKRSEDALQLPVVAPAQPPPAQAAATTKRLAGGNEIVFDTFIQEKAKEEGGCAICLVEYEDGETLATITSCKHRYHVFCIGAWLKDHDTCPLCRTQ
ncbi:hypothetical protein MIMGU_mgv1a017791mg, partial [Erythranthe guttata]